MSDMSIKDKISILYRRFKVKFDDLVFYTENINSNDKIRVFIADFNYIFNNIYGFSHIISNNCIELFDDKYTEIHVINLLSVLAHYRRFFYSRSEAKINYLFLYRSDINLKRPWVIFNNIVNRLKQYTDFIPFLYVNDNIKKPSIFYKEIIEQGIIKRNNKETNVNYFVFTKDNMLKSFIYSVSNRYFENSDIFVLNFRLTKLIMDDYKKLYYKFYSFFQNDDKIIQKSFKENFYKFVLITTLDSKFRGLRTDKKIKLLNKCFVDKTISIDDIIDENSKPAYKEIIEDLLTNDMYNEIVHQELINKEIKLYDKSILTMNMNIEDDNQQNIADWLFESKYKKNKGV